MHGLAYSQFLIQVPILLSSTNSPASSFALQKEESFPKEP